MGDSVLSRSDPATRAPHGADGHGASFRPDIQGLRAVAVAVVVLYHANLGFPGGYVGVDVFFVVSGYVITLMLKGQLNATGRIGLRDFYLRRIRRLLPALALMLVVVLALSPLLGPAATGQLTRRTGASGSLFLSNVYLMRLENGYFDVDSGANPLLHIWSLSVEEQFYLAYPLLLILAWSATRRLRRPTRATITVLLAAATASLALCLILQSSLSPLDDDLSQRAAFFLSPTRAWEFLIGAVLAFGAFRFPERLAMAAGPAGIALLSVAVFTFDDRTTFPGWAALVPVAGAALLLLAGTAPSAPTTRVLSLRSFQYVGDLSYSWYLWHWPMIVFARAVFPGSSWAGPVAAAASLAPAAVSYRWIETPFRRRTRMRPLPTLALGAVCVALPIVMVVAALGLERQWPTRVTKYMAALGPHNYQSRPCDDTLEPVDPVACTWNVGAGSARGHVALLGDSNAGHFSEAFLNASDELGLDATILTRSSCPFADLYLARRDHTVDQECRSFYETQMRWLTRTKPDLVVLSAVSDSLIEYDMLMTGARGDPWLESPAAKQRLWSDALTRTMKRLADEGIHVLVVHPIPRFKDWPDPTLCAPITVMIDESACAGSVKRSTAWSNARRSFEAEDRAVEAVPGSMSLDLWPRLCGDQACRMYRGGKWWFRNWNHLSATGSSNLTRAFVGAIASALHNA